MRNDRWLADNFEALKASIVSINLNKAVKAVSRSVIWEESMRCVGIGVKRGSIWVAVTTLGSGPA